LFVEHTGYKITVRQTSDYQWSTSSVCKVLLKLSSQSQVWFVIVVGAAEEWEDQWGKGKVSTHGGSCSSWPGWSNAGARGGRQGSQRFIITSSSSSSTSLLADFICL